MGEVWDPKEIMAAAEEAIRGRPPAPEEAARWLEPPGWSELLVLMAAARRVQEAFEGRAVEVCAIVNAKSGRCSEDCAFCAQSARHSAHIDVYGLLEPEEILSRARQAEGWGVGRFSIVTSGRACPEGRQLVQICRAVELIRRHTRLVPCVSLGLLTPAQARTLADAGVVRYHHNLETSRNFFRRICTTHSYEERLATIEAARAAGMEVCVGGIVGMGESLVERARLAGEIAALAPQSVPLNFLNPIPGTALEGQQMMSPIEALAAVAVFKLMNPRAVVRTCGGRQQVLGGLAPLMYLAGAGGTMTGDYLTTTGRSPAHDMADIAKLGLVARLIDTEAEGERTHAPARG